MPQAAIPGGLNPFQEALIGTWTNKDIGTTGRGGPGSPLSYNVMPLPQVEPQFGQNDGYILKNFSYYETVQFDGPNDVSIPATAPNRGSDTLQVPTALFYSQLVFFAEGPATGQVVHVENGAWLNIRTGAQIVGPYNTPTGAPISLDNPNKQPPTMTIAKQISVPHGNSVLAPGSFGGATKGAPVIPDAASILPTPVIGTGQIGTDPYTQQLDQADNYENPSPDLTANPNAAIQQAVALIAPNSYMSWSVSTQNKGATLNIPFEQRQADVAAYAASYWLLSTDDGSTYPYLVYTQTITLQITIGNTRYNFPHTTCNCVTKS
jgi:hypothetical protein